MSRTVIDLDDALLERAREILETTTKRDTVTEALRHVVVQQARAELVEWLASGTYTEAHAVTVIHYDSDFDLIARFTGQPVEWVVPEAPFREAQVRDTRPR